MRSCHGSMQEKHMQVAYRCPFLVNPPLQAGKAEAPAVQGYSQAPACAQDLGTAETISSSTDLRSAGNFWQRLQAGQRCTADVRCPRKLPAKPACSVPSCFPQVDLSCLWDSETSAEFSFQEGFLQGREGKAALLAEQIRAEPQA